MSSRAGLWLLVGAVVAMLVVLGVAVGRRAGHTGQAGQRPPWQDLTGRRRGDRRHRLRRPRSWRASVWCRWRGHRQPPVLPVGWSDQVCRVCHQHVPMHGGKEA